eukprot:m.101067 g.101067  ORF g.101067 m.101067 type:complete len:555 (-) comp15157_c0_seq2:41-1705(-)
MAMRLRGGPVSDDGFTSIPLGDVSASAADLKYAKRRRPCYSSRWLWSGYTMTVVACLLLLAAGKLVLSSYHRHQQVKSHQATLQSPLKPTATAIVTPATATDRAFLHNGSHVHCHGDDVDTRQCRVHGLCYHVVEHSYFILHGPNSLLTNVPADRYNPALLSLSSVERHNIQYFNYADMPTDFLSTLDGPMYMVQPKALLFRRFKPDNIMHALHDDVLPVYATLQEMDGIAWNSTLLVAVDNFRRDLPSLELLAMLSERPILHASEFPKDAQVICYRDVTLGLSKRTTWYDYGFDRPQGPIPGKALDATIVHRYAAFVRERLSLPKPKPNGLVVLFSRTRNRFILNENELIKRFKSDLKRRVVVVRMETHSFRDQVELLSQADAAVGMHGSILILSMFLPSKSAVLELFPFGVDPSHYTPYKTMALAMGMVYQGWNNTIEAMTVPHPNRPAALGGLRHLGKAERLQVEQTPYVPLHKCCNDPYWLYRIYSDTRVDVPVRYSGVPCVGVPPNGPHACIGSGRHASRLLYCQHHFAFERARLSTRQTSQHPLQQDP